MKTKVKIFLIMSLVHIGVVFFPSMDASKAHSCFITDPHVSLASQEWFGLPYCTCGWKLSHRVVLAHSHSQVALEFSPKTGALLPALPLWRKAT